VEDDTVDGRVDIAVTPLDALLAVEDDIVDGRVDIATTPLDGVSHIALTAGKCDKDSAYACSLHYKLSPSISQVGPSCSQILQQQHNKKQCFERMIHLKFLVKLNSKCQRYNEKHFVDKN
jgi:hypothetical protein